MFDLQPVQMMNWLRISLAALIAMASLVTALPSRGTLLEARTDTGRFVFAHLIVGFPFAIDEVVPIMLRSALFLTESAPPIGMRICSEPKHTALMHLH